MKYFLFFFTLLFSATPLIVSAESSDQVNIEKALRSDLLNDVRTITVIDDHLFLIDHVRVQPKDEAEEEYTEKRVYRLGSDDMNTLDLVFAGRAPLNVDEQIIEYNNDLYMTLTGKIGDPVRLFKSEDDGFTWNEAASIGFENEDISNSVADLFTTQDRMYVVVQPKRITDLSIPRTVAVWSSADGVEWEENVIERKSVYYGGYSVLEDVPYVFVNIRYGATGHRKSASAVYSPSQPNGSVFAAVSYRNLNPDVPTRSINQVLSFKDAVFIQGVRDWQYNNSTVLTRPHNQRSLRSTNGLTWKKVGEKFARFVLHRDTLFAQTASKTYLSNDGSIFHPLSFNFEDDFNIMKRSLTFFSSQEHELLFARFVHDHNKDDDHSADDLSKQCLVSTDGVSWLGLDTCAIKDRVDHRQIVKFGNFWYFVQGKEWEPLQLSRLSVD